MPIQNTRAVGSAKGYGFSSSSGGGVAWSSSLNIKANVNTSVIPLSTRSEPPPVVAYTGLGSWSMPPEANWVYSNGYHYFDIFEGSYSVAIGGAEGAGTSHGYGAMISGTLIVEQPARLVALAGLPGTGNYSGGGMSAVAICNSGDNYTNVDALIVAGGGGGGYSVAMSNQDGGPTSWPATSQRGSSADCTGLDGVYDGGASFYTGVHIIRSYNCLSNQPQRAYCFVEGGRGGTTTGCGNSPGGFGSGGGSCPAGAGGYYGGVAGGNGPAVGGGGGTSYRRSSGPVRISSWADVGTNGSQRGGQPGTATGYVIITPIP